MIIVNLKRVFTKYIFIIYGKTHPIKKKVVFTSFFGKQYSDNPRAICEKMHEIYPDYELVWLLNDKKNKLVPDYIRVVANEDRFFSWGREIATAASFVYNVERNFKIYRKKEQSFIQTWHGDRAIKKFLRDKNPRRILYENELTTLCVAGSSFGEKQYKSAFGYMGEVLTTGSPRNDRLLHLSEEENKKIRSRLNIPANKKVLLYAPTFRDNKKNELQKITVDITGMLNAFPDQENWLCLIRAHVASMGLKADFNDDRIIDVTEYPDMADILCIADFLVSDYSSCATDFSLTEKPIILALFDRQEYQDNCREFIVEPEIAGFLTAYNQKELEQMIRSTSIQTYQEACKRVNAFYGVKETGHASEDVCCYIDNYYKNHI